MAVYNKLVRDKIPAIIEESGTHYSTKTLSQENYINALRAKLIEEANEYLEAKNDQDSKEELADIMELLHALAKTHDATIDQIEEIRQKKAENRGGFQDKTFLIEVNDDEN